MEITPNNIPEYTYSFRFVTPGFTGDEQTRGFTTGEELEAEFKFIEKTGGPFEHANNRALVAAALECAGCIVDRIEGNYDAIEESMQRMLKTPDVIELPG